MMCRWTPVSQRIAVVVTVLSLMGEVATLLAPTTSDATPLAGNYVFTSGLTGTFTSDGAKLTAWNIVGPLGGHFTTDTTALNDSDLFITLLERPSLSLIWADQKFFEDTVTGALRTNTFTFSRTAVPEGSTMVLSVLGLIGVMACSWHRHQASHQSGQAS